MITLNVINRHTHHFECKINMQHKDYLIQNFMCVESITRKNSIPKSF